MYFTKTSQKVLLLLSILGLLTNGELIFQAINNDEQFLTDTSRLLSNIDFIASGYNIFKGNPKYSEGGRDPGFSPNKIFTITYEEGKVSGDLTFKVPDAIDV